MEYANIQNHLITCPADSETVVFPKAEGACFMDEDGNRCINLNDISCVLGYGHPVFTQKLSELVQTKLLGHFGTFSPDKELLLRLPLIITEAELEQACDVLEEVLMDGRKAQ